MQLLAIATPLTVDDDVDVRLAVTRIKAQQLLLNRTRLGPVLVLDKADRGIDQIIPRLVGERDRPRLHFVDRELRNRGGFDQLELLRHRRRLRRKHHQRRQRSDRSERTRCHQ
jgi:hypothetical protein